MATEKSIPNNWTEEELRAYVESYLDIQRRLRLGDKPVKKRYYEILSKKFGRSLKAYEYRLQNISYVMNVQGREWVSGLAPMSNVGANVAAKIENILADLQHRKPNPNVEFDVKVERERAKSRLDKPSGNTNPKKKQTIIDEYQRDYLVKAWVLKNAKGVCECCNNKAPFVTSGKLPYLEVHHVKSLVEGGSDCIENAVAICPNCHREAHYGINKKKLSESLYKKIPRLVRE